MSCPRSFAISALLCLVLSTGLDARSDPRTKIQSTIDSLRGTTLKGMTDREQEALHKKLSKAWSTYRKYKRDGVEIIHEILEKEQEDSFIILDLSMYLLSQDSSMESLARVATYVQKADPHASDNVFFILTSQMAARRCMPCLPAVLKILDLEELDAYIPEHALPVNLIYGLMFTVYQYGDSIISVLEDLLDSSECPVRANAAFALGDLTSPEIPPVLSKMALEDSCEYARAAALQAAASFMHPDLEQLAMKRMALDAPFSPHGKEALLLALGMAGTDTAKKTLRAFTSDPNAEISKFAEMALSVQPPDLSIIGTAPQKERRRVLRELRKALKKGWFDDTPDQMRYLAALTSEDIPLVNEARAAVLARLSDECLYEWYPLTGVAKFLRAKQRQSSAPK